MADPARIDGMSDLLGALAPALDDFLRFEGPDGAARRSVWRAALDRPLPEQGAGAEAVIAELARLARDHGLRLGAPGFLGWVSSGPALVPAVAQLTATIAAGQRWWVGPGGFLEGLALRWLAELLGLPPSAGALVSGGAVANLVALAAARQRAGMRLGVDVAEQGAAVLTGPRIYVTENAHPAIARVAAVLGLGRGAVVVVGPPTSPSPRERGVVLRASIAQDRDRGATPVAIVATAGGASTGAIDPIEEMAAVAAETGVWLHVDGAYGGFAAVDPRLRGRFAGLAAADSLVVDPHKWLAVPAGCGAVLVRDAEALAGALSAGAAPYLEYTRRGPGDPASAFDELGEGNPDHTVEHSAPARGLVVWAALAEIGAAGVRARVGRHLDCARRVAERVRAEPELELLAEPELSVVCFRVVPAGVRASGELEKLNREVLRGVRARGRVIPSSTRVGSKLAIRACFLGPRTDLADADALVDEVVAVTAAAARARGGSAG